MFNFKLLTYWSGLFNCNKKILYYVLFPKNIRKAWLVHPFVSSWGLLGLERGGEELLILFINNRGGNISVTV